MSVTRRLIADIGGTNARFACSDPDGSIHDERVHPVAGFATFVEALDAYLSVLDESVKISSAVVAAAGPVDDDVVSLTNNDWQISTAKLKERLGTTTAVRVINDLEAVAHALPYLGNDDVEFSNCRPSKPGDRMLAVNVGTGFGAASLIRTPHGWVSCPSEAGHMELGAINSGELELFRQLSDQVVTVENILSGDGVRQLARLSGAANGKQQGPGSSEITTPILARVSANLALASTAWGGVYFCGSVATAWWREANHSDFRRHFCGSSKMRDRLEKTPVGLIKTAHPAFLGLANLVI